MQHLQCLVLLLSLSTESLHGASLAAAPIKVPLIADRWHALQNINDHSPPRIQFIRHEGIPQGTLVIESGSAVLDNLDFRDGTIEFDMKATEQDIPGIQFRHQGVPGQDEAEEFYLRSFPDCRASDDCIQYAPIIRGSMLWNVYPQYQVQAPILEGWNHFKLIVSGRRMNVYINYSTQPNLMVGNLESSSDHGSIQLRGPAIFANLVITPGAVESLRGFPAVDPSAADSRIVRQWQVGSQTADRAGENPHFSDAPPDANWKSVMAGRFGLVNLNREFSLDLQATPLNWLRTTVHSKVAQRKRFHLGWLGHVWIFANGQLVAEGKNFYDPEIERRDPDGRLSLENGSFEVPLQEGNNQIMLVLSSGIHDSPASNNLYGSGTILRFDDTEGLRFSGL